ncbi:MAG: ABC transporter substrate-binding protein [Caldimonas sp.]
MLGRRLFCQALAGTGVTVSAFGAAQTRTKVYRMGHLEIGRADESPGPPSDPIAIEFETELARLGLVEGVNRITDYRSARGNPTLLDGLAADLVAAQPDVLFTGSGFVGARALKRATTTIPIVFAAVGNPVAAGLVASLARPGGNLTGGSVPVELDLKRVQILFEVLGASASIVLLTTPVSEPRMAWFLKDLTASRLRVKFQEVRKSEDLAPAFEQMARQRADGVAVASSLLTGTHQPEIAALAIKHRIPAIGDGTTFTDLGLMMSYSVDWLQVARNAANYLYKILNGAQPVNLPIQQVTNFDFVVNRKAARALSIRIPSPVLIAATRIID